MSHAPSETTPPPAAGPGGRPADADDGRRRRLASYTVRNMVFSVLAVLVLVLAWWSLTFNPQEDQRRPPEVTQSAAHAVEQAGWPVWVPEPGEGWKPTVVWFDPIEEVRTWHISYTSPEGEYVALHQAADVTPEWLGEVLKGAEEVGEVTLEGPGGAGSWQEWAGEERSNAERGYLLGPEATGGTTVVLHGTASQQEFEEFLATVEARE